MAIPGQIVSAGQRSAMLADITRNFRAGDNAIDWMHPSQLAREATDSFDLATYEPAQAAALYRAMRDATVQVDEGNCFNRALNGAFLGGRMLDLPNSPLDRVVAGALAVRPYQHDGGTYTGAFHTKLAVQVRGKSELQVIDPLPGNPITQDLSEWVDPSQVQLLQPFQGTGLAFDGGGRRARWVNEDGLAFAAKNLQATILAAVPEGGGVVRNPLPWRIEAAQRRLGM